MILKTIRVILVSILLVILGFFVFLNIHELSHNIAARLLADPTSTYAIYRRYPGGFCLGCNDWDETGSSKLVITIVSLAGVIGTRLFSELVQLARRWPGTTGWSRPFWIMLFISTRADLIAYIIRNGISHGLLGGGYEGQDMAHAVHLISGGNQSLNMVVYVGFFLLALLDLILDRRRIRRFFRGTSEEMAVQPA